MLLQRRNPKRAPKPCMHTLSSLTCCLPPCKVCVGAPHAAVWRFGSAPRRPTSPGTSPASAPDRTENEISKTAEVEPPRTSSAAALPPNVPGHTRARAQMSKMTPASTSPAKSSFWPQRPNGSSGSDGNVPGRGPNQLVRAGSNAHLFGTIYRLFGGNCLTELSTRPGCQGSRPAAKQANIPRSGQRAGAGSCSVAGAEFNTNVSAHQTAASFLSLKCQWGEANKNRRAIR